MFSEQIIVLSSELIKVTNILSNELTTWTDHCFVQCVDHGIVVCLFQSCSYFSSNTFPLRLVMRNVDQQAESVYAMFKVGPRMNQVKQGWMEITYGKLHFHFQFAIKFHLSITPISSYQGIVCNKISFIHNPNIFISGHRLAEKILIATTM